MGIYRPRNFGSFDPSKPLVAGRQMPLNGKLLAGGDPIPADTDEGIKRRLWMVEHAHYAEDYTPTPELKTHGEDLAWMDEDRGVTVTAGENGWHTITAPWLPEEGEKVRGAENAETRATELREAGDTKGVEYEHTGGGWYTITAPFLSEPIKVKGEEEAKAKAVELRETAPPTGADDGTAPDAGSATEQQQDGGDQQTGE
jgi:hypothetical protein